MNANPLSIESIESRAYRLHAQPHNHTTRPPARPARGENGTSPDACERQVRCTQYVLDPNFKSCVGTCIKQMDLKSDSFVNSFLLLSHYNAQRATPRHRVSATSIG